MWILEHSATSESRQNGQLVFESEGQQVNLGEGHVPPAPT